ncbi:carboxypeptidase regulatory-like domain-containing protein [Archangium lansingense]|uniref:carboxypeptidase regulatory-like domain-containing protein n=1 Tax=Archangium lansingense TaxID=2995310 RepID=UPI003B7DA4E5
MATPLHKQLLAASAFVVLALGVAVVWGDLPGSKPAVPPQRSRPVREAPTPPPRGDGAIQGRVVAWDGTPVAGVEVSATLSQPGKSLSSLACEGESPNILLSSPNCEGAPRWQLTGLIEQGLGAAPVVARTTSSADGSFSLTGLPDGAVAVWALDARGARMEPRVEVGATGVKLVLGRSATLSGRVVDEAGRPLQGASVTLFLAEHSRYFEATTDAQGRFLLGPLLAGRPHGLVAHHLGLLPAYESLSSLQDTGDVVLHAPRRLVGQVLDGEHPVADADVVASETGQSARTSGDGRFILEDMPPGEHKVTASTSRKRGHASVTLEEGYPEATVRIELGSLVSFSGTVKDSEEHPIPDAVVEVEGSDKEKTLSDTQGRFTFEALSPGNYKVTVRAEGYSDRRFPHVAPATTPTLDVVLKPTALVRGVLVDTEGHPVPKAIVQLAESAVDEDFNTQLPPPEKVAGNDEPGPMGGINDPHESRVHQLRADENGRFAFERDSPGRFALRVDSDRYLPLQTLVAAPATDLRLVLQPGARVEGRVVDAQGLPLAQVELSLHTGLDEPEVIAPMDSDEHGRFVLGGIAPGHYILLARFDQGAPHGTTLPIEVIGTETLEAVVRLDTGLSVSGIVVDESNRPIPHVQIEAKSATGLYGPQGGDSPSSSKAITDEQGRFTVRHLLPGPCELDIDIPGHELSRVRAAGTDSRGKQLVVPAGSTDVTLTFRYLGGVRGRLVHEDGTPITSFSINSYSHRDPQGAFQQNLRWPGPIELAISAPERTPILLSEIEVEPGQLKELGDIVMKARRLLRGRVTHALTGEPIEGARVTRKSADSEGELSGFGRDLKSSTDTRHDGSFELEGVEADGLVLEVELNHDSPKHRQPIGAGDTWVDIRMTPGARLQGTVTDSEGHPVETSLLLLADSSEVRVHDDIISHGRYDLDGLSPGTYRVVPTPVEAPGKTPIRFKPQTVVLAFGSRHVLNFQAQRGDSRLTLLLSDEEGPAPDDERVIIDDRVLVAGDLPLPEFESMLAGVREALEVPLDDASASRLSAGRYTYFLLGRGKDGKVVHREVVDVGPGEDIVRRIRPRWTPILARIRIYRDPCYRNCSYDGWESDP